MLILAARIVGYLSLAALLALVGCGRADGENSVEGILRAGDADFWLVDGTLVAIGGAQITGQPSQIGSRVHAQGRRAADGILEAETITVGKVESVEAASSLTATEVSGVVETLEAASGRWRVQGRVVLVPNGVAAPRVVAIGDRVTVRGYALPNGDLLAAEIDAAGQAPTVAPTATTTPTTRPPAVPPHAPAATPTPAPDLPKPAPSAQPPQDDDDDDDDGDKRKDKDKKKD